MPTALWLLLPSTCIGHVQFGYPSAIIDDDYQYTFDGSCQGDSCDAFCGSEGPAPPLTTVPLGPLNLTINVNVKHPPYKYRISLGSGSPPAGFDTNVLLDDIASPGDAMTQFNVTVDIPDVSCDSHCTLQLYDYYYFVSCANILVVSNTGTTEDEEPASVNDGLPGSEGQDTSPDQSSGGALSPSAVSFTQEAADDGAVMINATLTLPTPSWFAVAMSPSSAMIGSRAVIGLPSANGTTVDEFDLNGKFSEAIEIIGGDESSQLVSLSSSFDIVDNDDGGYVHHLSVVLPFQISAAAGGSFLGTIDLCGINLLWAHANPGGGIPTDVLGYHGTYRGVLGTIECPLPMEMDGISVIGNASNTIQGRGQSDNADASAASKRGKVPFPLLLALNLIIGSIIMVYIHK